MLSLLVVAGALAGIGAWLRSLRRDPEWEPLPTESSDEAGADAPTQDGQDPAAE